METNCVWHTRRIHFITFKVKKKKEGWHKIKHTAEQTGFRQVFTKDGMNDEIKKYKDTTNIQAAGVTYEASDPKRRAAASQMSNK